jgi:hypothetical protein
VKGIQETTSLIISILSSLIIPSKDKLVLQKGNTEVEGVEQALPIGTTGPAQEEVWAKSVIIQTLIANKGMFMFPWMHKF